MPWSRDGRAGVIRVVHAYNLHRRGGGSDDGTLATVRLQRAAGLDVETFSRDSRELKPGLRGEVSAFINGLYASGAVRQFAALLEASKPDVVHAHELFPLLSPWILPEATRRNVPVVMSCFDYRLTCPVVTHFSDGGVCTKCLGGREYQAVLRNCRGRRAESFAYALRSLLARRFDLYRRHVRAFVTPTEFSSHWLVSHADIAPERVLTVPYATELVPEGPVEHSTGRYIGFAGRIAPEKGVDLLIRAARLAQVPVAIAGGTTSYPGADGVENVQLVPGWGAEPMRQFYRNARAIVVPSLWFETYPLVISEAMSHGLPVIASRLGALAEVVRDGVDGLLFEPGNATDLAEKLVRLWSDSELCRRLGRAGRERIRRTSSPRAHLDGLMNAYRVAGVAITG